jgi:hypothetical protein
MLAERFKAKLVRRRILSPNHSVEGFLTPSLVGPAATLRPLVVVGASSKILYS